MSISSSDSDNEDFFSTCDNVNSCHQLDNENKDNSLNYNYQHEVYELKNKSRIPANNIYKSCAVASDSDVASSVGK
jgi:uncharacterized protein YecT (DUF1311 family)